MKYETTLRGAELGGSLPAGAAEHLAKIDAHAARADTMTTEEMFAQMPPPGEDAGQVPESQVNRLKMVFGSSVEVHRIQ